MKTMLTALAALLLPVAASAQTYPEAGDAGQTLGAAANTTKPATGMPVTSITGTLGAFDADLFKIYIGNPGAFTATTDNAVTNTAYPGGLGLDTALYLFNEDGTAFAANDDEPSGLHVSSTLSALTGLSVGYYFLGIAISGNEPVNSANQLLFAMGGNFATRPAATGVSPATLFDFDGNPATDPTPGAYRIDLTGVSAGPAATAVPEPASWALMLGGFGLIGGALRRRGTRAVRTA